MTIKDETNPLQAEVDRLRAEVEDLRQAIAAGPIYPPPGTACGVCGNVNERGAGFDGRRTH
jgi:hypothetical protein